MKSEWDEVELGGISYKCDRFYLNAVKGDNLEHQPQHSGCDCGSEACNPPPLFYREKLSELNMKAAILGTFSLSLGQLSEEFPQLVGPESTVPTLLLHGRKGFSNRFEKYLFGFKGEVDDPESEEQEHEYSPAEILRYVAADFDEKEDEEENSKHNNILAKMPIPSFQYCSKDTDCQEANFAGEVDISSVATQEEPTSLSGIQLQYPVTCRLPLQESSANTEDNSQEHGGSSCCSSRQRHSFQPSLSTYLNAHTMKDLYGEKCHIAEVKSTYDTSIAGVSHENQKEKQLEYQFGVHHPKFMLLFEEDDERKAKSIVVVVSTANLVPTGTTEGSWIQRFPIRGSKKKLNRERTNDFGFVLADFLQRLSKSCERADLWRDNIVERFLKEYKLGFNLKDLPLYYRFEKAGVHLIPTVVGKFDHADDRYGRQRLRSVLKKMNDIPMTGKDKLIMQPTSIGGKIVNWQLADVVKSYLDFDGSDYEKVLERCRIVWPSRSFIRKAIGSETHSSFLFFSSDCFNSLDETFIEKMEQFEDSKPMQHHRTMIPHFKSIARIYDGKRSSMFSQSTFSWFLLTSSCLSHGAQGRLERDERTLAPISISYANFELGVLFTSTTKPKFGNKRLYCFAPKQCCSSKHRRRNGLTPMIHLPVPYNTVKEKSYMKNEDERKMIEIPFFHEIVGTGGKFSEMMPDGYLKLIKRVKRPSWEDQENKSREDKRRKML